MNTSQIEFVIISQYNFNRLKHVSKIVFEIDDDIDDEIYEKIPGFESLRKILIIIFILILVIYC